jgi:hypothetical protein
VQVPRGLLAYHFAFFGQQIHGGNDADIAL